MKYKGFIVGRCDTVAYLTGTNNKWMVRLPWGNHVRFETLREAKEWINEKINEKQNKHTAL